LHELSKQSCQGKAERKKAKEVSQRRKRSKLSDFKAQADEQKYDFRSLLGQRRTDSLGFIALPLHLRRRKKGRKVKAKKW
jgi:hypothetical protein